MFTPFRSLDTVGSKVIADLLHIVRLYANTSVV